MAMQTACRSREDAGLKEQELGDTHQAIQIRIKTYSKAVKLNSPQGITFNPSLEKVNCK